MTRKPRPAPYDGALVIDKPRGRTSHDVVEAVRRILGFRQIGHLGTLDPLATGVLVLLLGRATRFAQFYAGRRKRYECAFRFGFATDTYDADGTPLGPDANPQLDKNDLERLAAGFTGQIPADAAPFFRQENPRPPGARTGPPAQAGGTQAGRNRSLRVSPCWRLTGRWRASPWSAPPAPTFARSPTKWACSSAAALILPRSCAPPSANSRSIAPSAWKISRAPRNPARPRSGSCRSETC